MSADTPVIHVPYGDDPLRHLATLLLERLEAGLPDLSNQVVLFPYPGAIPRFRRLLAEQARHRGFEALLPPHTGTLASWACRFADHQKRRLGFTAREILLLGLLQEHFPWRRQHGGWALVESLLTLFDELTLHQCRMPENSYFMSPATASDNTADMEDLSPFSHEARLIRTMWQKWREHLEKNRLEDQARQFTEGLDRSLDNFPSNIRIFLAGFSDLSRAESRWLKALTARRCLTLLVHGTDAGNTESEIDAHIPQRSDAYAEFLDRAYASEQGHLLQRAQQQTAVSPSSPARGRLTLHVAPDAESEARAIDLQVRRWLMQGRRDIGIVTNDRKLARRVRALLERANIGLQDGGGWALSTTSAATALARWLECLEQNFHHSCLFDLLKCPFLKSGIPPEKLENVIALFEQSIARSQNIAFGLDNYLHALERNDIHWTEAPETRELLARLIGRLKQAAAPLVPLMSVRPRAASEFLEALQKSLVSLGLAAGLEHDDAGHELLALLQEMRQAGLSDNDMRLSWEEFHRWFRRGMEQRRFRPPMKGRGVELMSFAESRLYRFDALIIAGAVREHLPGPIDAPAFFNDGVRTELGLPSLARRYGVLFRDFRRLLDAAPQVLVSLRREQHGENLAPSPWVERVRAFHELAYHDELNDPELEWLVGQTAAVVVNRERPLPTPVPRPFARLPRALVPKVFTATDCQRLIDCPYQFFGARGLGLTPEDEIREEMEKMDYGNHVHAILHAFHSGAPGLPGPWHGKLDAATRPDAEMLLRKISRAIFDPDRQGRFISRGWLYRWEKCIPAYLDWEQQRAKQWRFQATELKKEHALKLDGAHIALTGRIDRLDKGESGYGIIDYKTGAVPSLDMVLSGEKIQLPFYALLLEQEKIARMAFLALDNETAKEKAPLEGESLTMLLGAIRERLILLKRGLEAETPLPASGDLETCRLCEMEGLCRREMWHDQPAA